MTDVELKRKTMALALRVIEVFRDLPYSEHMKVIRKQIIRSSSSVGANYRAACRARSRAEMVSKLGIVLEEAGETIYWLELAKEAHVVKALEADSLAAEAEEIVKIMVSSIKTLRGSETAIVRESGAWFEAEVAST